LFRVALVSPWVEPLDHYSAFRDYAKQTGLIEQTEYDNQELKDSEKNCLSRLTQTIT
jgi:hypothetical protein